MMKKSVYFIAVGIIGTSFLGFLAHKHFRAAAQSTDDSLSEQKTIKILKEIKHQMMISCISFTVEMLKMEGKVNFADPKTIQWFRGEIVKIYEQKEDLILKKHGLSRQLYATALKRFKTVKLVKDNNAELLDMMERAVVGRLLNLDVKPEAKAAFSKKKLSEIYYVMCKQIVTKVCERVQEKIRDDPSFDCRDELSFRQAIRSLQISDFKIQFLGDQGFQQMWGCPNEVFFKLIESYKHSDLAYKKELEKIEISYGKAIEAISIEPSTVTKQQIDEYFRDSDPNKVAEPKLAKKPIAQAKIQSVVQPTEQPTYLIPSEQADAFKKSQEMNILTSIKSDPEENVLEISEPKVVQENMDENKEQEKVQKKVQDKAEEPSEIVEQNKGNQQDNKISEDNVVVQKLLEEKENRQELEVEVERKDNEEKHEVQE